MSIRRVWTIQQDRILKMLKEQRSIKKWSSIARIMDFQFNMCGRNGKQCRQRYNNHLSEGILQQRLSFQEEKLLEKLNDQIGNKWSVIAKAFKGRTANFLKNQLYSKLRKSIRKLSKFIKQMKIKNLKPYKLNIVYKIVQSNDFKIFEKQRHTEDDLKLYSDIKQKLFIYAEEPLVIESQSVTKNDQLIMDSKELIQLINQFSNKFEAFNKKTKKPRKRYFCQDDIILNSLSNNKTYNAPFQKEKENIQQQAEMSKQSQSENDQSSQTSDKKYEKKLRSQDNNFQLKMYNSRNFDHQKQRFFDDKYLDQTPKNAQKFSKNVLQLQKMANENLKIVEEGELDYSCRDFRLLQQSEQCHFIDVQYLEHFKSCSIMDESLFQ